MFEELKQDFGYAVKVIRSTLAGYQELNYRVDSEWEFVEDGDLPDYPYYVCAAFRNGRHIPLPLVIGDYEDGSPGPMQKAVLNFMRRHAGLTGLFRGFRDALRDCAKYENDFRAQWEDEDDYWEGYDEETKPYLSQETLERLQAIQIDEVSAE